MKRSKVFIAVMLAAALLLGCGCSNGSGKSTGTGNDSGSEIENYTRYADYTPVKAKDAGIRSGSDGKILVAYFSRSANTSLSDTDAVSSASLNIQKNGKASGNAQQIAEWIADETGGDLYPIQTMYTYPVDYDQTVDVGEGQDEDGVRPALINKIDVSSYDLIYLVHPIWHYTVPAPVESFLEDHDFSGKTICSFTTSGGSGFADVIEKIRDAEPDARVVKGVTVSQDSVSGSRSEVRSAAASLKKKYENKNTGKETSVSEVQIKINGRTFTAELENNDTAKAFLKKLPLKLRMNELNGNEKYAYNVSLPSDEESVKKINTGDLMLFGDDCLVLFYDTFSTSYSYTRIGHITDTDGLADAVGSGKTEVTFSAE